MHIKNLIAHLSTLPAHEKRLTVSTILTIARLLLIPVLLGMIMMQRWTAALFLLLVAAITDVLDGYLARTFNQQTILGALLDPLADKLLTVGSFSVLVIMGYIPWWFALLALLKELTQILGAAAIFSLSHKKIAVHVTWLGKAAMLGQTLLIAWVIGTVVFVWLPAWIENWLLVGVSGLMLASLLYYAYLWFYHCTRESYESQ